MKKICSKCNKEKPLLDYYETHKVGTYFSKCKCCTKEYNKSRYLEKISTLEGHELAKKINREKYYRLYQKKKLGPNINTIPKLENSEIIEKINSIFEGDFSDNTPLHCNSLCRIAYIGYLSNLGLKPRDIQKNLNWEKHQVAHRKIKHNSLYKFSPDYRKKFDSII